MKKAGFLAIGSDAAAAAARSGKVALVISASDATEGALRRARHIAGYARAEHVVAPYTKFELGNVTGRGSPGTIAVLDAGLAAGFVRNLAESAPEQYGEISGLLASKAGSQTEKRKPTPSGKRRTVK